MKSYLIIFLLVLTSFTSTDSPIDRLGVKGPLQFNNNSYSLVWTSHPDSTFYVQEYLPEGQKVENFKQLLTIYFLNENKKIEDFVHQKILELDRTKKNDPVCNYKLNESPDGKEFMLDFLVSKSDDNDKLKLIEFSIYRYKQVELTNGQKGLMIFAYSKRAYGDDIERFLKTLGDDRGNLLNTMIGTEIPAINIQNN
jgi:hypothetical protein